MIRGFSLVKIYAALEVASERGNNLSASGVSMNKANQTHKVTVLIISENFNPGAGVYRIGLYRIHFPTAATDMDNARPMNRIT